MTRLEAKSKIRFLKNATQMAYLIDKIYDDFENKTCESCKHYVIDDWLDRDIDFVCDKIEPIFYKLILYKGKQ